MKILLIIYNILFLFVGNDIFLQINHCSHHDHSHHNHESFHEHNHDHEQVVDYHNCDECLNFNSDENYLDSFQYKISLLIINQYVLENFNTIAYQPFREYYKRGPPQV